MFAKYKVKFPIKEVVKYMGQEKVKTLNRHDAVKCIRCGQPIVISRETVIPFGDGEYMVECHNPTFDDKVCGYRANVYYYFDRKMPAIYSRKTEKPNEVRTEKTSGAVTGLPTDA